MRIQSIRINKETNLITIGGDRQLRGVILTVKEGLFGKTKEIKAFPTSYGIPGTSGRIIFYYFCDESGKELSTDVSQQINNFLLNQQLLTGKSITTAELDKFDADEFLGKKDIWNHPRVSDRNNKESYEVADLMAEFANEYSATLPNDDEVKKWFDENISAGCSASSAIYKFRIWLNDITNGTK